LNPSSDSANPEPLADLARARFSNDETVIPLWRISAYNFNLVLEIQEIASLPGRSHPNLAISDADS
jgi:hypothetical protein